MAEGAGELVGRDAELERARSAFSALGDGPRALLLEGEAGIGKTALWRGMLAEAHALDVRILSCVADQAEARTAFVVLSHLIRDVLDDVRPALSGPQREALEIAVLERRGGSSRPPDAKTMGVALRSLLVELARERPVVVAVDDVQWLDAGTLRALAFAVRRLGVLRVGLLTTVRVPHADPDVLGLERALGSDRVDRLRVEPLGFGALRALLALRLEYSYPRPVLRRISDASGGNPLFALEIARALGRSPSLRAGAPLPVPDSLRELATRRVAELPADARATLLVASALSHPRAELVELGSSLHGLSAAEEAGLLHVEDGRVLFAHPLYASAVYSSAATSRRRDLHRRLAELVTEPEERARHLALATSEPDESVASALDDAAAMSRARGAWETAGELLEQARALTPVGLEESARARGVRAAEHYIHAGDRPRARALLEDILPDTPPGGTRSDALRLLAEVLHNDYSFAEAARLLDEALANVEDPVQAVTIEMNLAYVHSQLLDFVQGDVHAARALERAESLGDDQYLAEPLAVRVHLAWMNGRGVDSDMLERALELESATRPMPLHFRPTLIAGMSALFTNRLAEARERLSAVRLAAADAGDESDVALVTSWMAWLETLDGDLDAAIATATEAEIEATLTNSDANRVWALAWRALAHAQRGDVTPARADAAEAVGIANRIGIVTPLIAVAGAVVLLELSLGDPAAAWDAASPAADQVEAHGVGDVQTALYLPDGLEALIGLGELDRAEKLLATFEHRARELDRPVALFTAARTRAVLLAERDDLDGARAAIDEALVEHERVRVPFELGRTLLVQGQILRRRRERRSARESLQKALEIFEQLGARLWAKQTRAELERLSGRRPSARGELTPSERRVVELAVAGHSNKEIAAVLFVTAHTVEVHLSHAYAKLGVHSRTQLAREIAANA